MLVGGVGDHDDDRARRVPSAVPVDGCGAFATGVVLFGLVVLAAAKYWGEVRDTVGEMSPLDLVLAELLVLAGLGASVLTWRWSLLELGSLVRLARGEDLPHRPAGKYVPGSFWAFLVQMEMAHRVSVPRSRALAASIVAAGVAVVSGLAVGLLVVHQRGREPRAALQRGRRPRRRLRRGTQSTPC